MHVTFESRDPEGAALRDSATARVWFVMRRMAWLVAHAKMRLTDVNGPRGGVDKQCRLELKTTHAGTVTITAMARDWRTAIEGALSRSSRMLLRNWRRRRERVQGHGHRHHRSERRELTPESEN